MKTTIGPVGSEFENDAEADLLLCIFGNGEHYVSMMVWTKNGEVVVHDYGYEHRDGRSYYHTDHETLEEALGELPQGVYFRAAEDVKQFRTVEYPLAFRGELDLEEV